MRIGMMVDMYKPHISGVTNFVAINKKFMEEAGHEVFVFTFGDRDYQDDEPNIIRSGSLPLPVKGFKFYFDHSKEARSLMKTMDVLHVQHPFISGPLAIIYGRRGSIPVVFTNHTRYDIYTRVYLPVIGGVVQNIIMKVYLPIFFKWLDLVMAPSPGMRQVLIKSGIDSPIDVVPNGIDLKAFFSPVQPVDRSRLGFSKDDVLFVFVGRLGDEKNLWLLMRAFKQAFQICPTACLIVIGDGPLRKELEEWVANNGLERRVCLTGLVPYDQMPAYLAMADVFATASVSEVHPFTVIEAMAAGLPVLGIRSPGVGDTVADGHAGYICPDIDQTQFADRMVKLAQDQDLRRRMGLQARSDSQQYDIHNTMQMLLDRYSSVIEQAARNKQERSKTSAKLGAEE